MGFLTKKAILKAYKLLSTLSPDPSVQGATQKVSAIRYFLALDQFYYRNNHNCNTRDQVDRKQFEENVGRVCEVCKNLYTPNFYLPLKEHNEDYCVGSNFYSAGQMKLSLESRDKIYEYPKRGKHPLFNIQDGELIRDIALYKNFKYYVSKGELMVALFIWILRKSYIDAPDSYLTPESFLATLSKLYTEELIRQAFPNKNLLSNLLGDYELKLNDNFYSIRPEDIEELFDVKPNINNPVEGNINKLHSNDELMRLAAIRTKPFLLLAGISGTGKSRIVRKLAQATVTEDLQREYEGEYKWDEGTFNEVRWTLHRPANFELIQVKPNWHNSMDVVGYLSNIPTPHYVFTPFINFIVRAMCHPEVPFFLCLDEMNLAPVEEYFAEFLSAIESRGKKDGKYITDPIIPPFKTYGEVDDEMGRKSKVTENMLQTLSKIIKKEVGDPESQEEIIKHLKEKGVTLPENLIIIGTVNMDETTFSFSRKVLDRAMSLEMNKVDYSSFLEDSTDDDIKAIAEAFKGDETSVENNSLNNLLIDRHVEAKEVVPELGGATEGSDARFVINYLETINKLLDGTPFKLGYRAANEALIYLRSSQEFGNQDRSDAMDKFTLMKILSRIEGDESKLKLSDSDSTRLKEIGVDYSKISGELGGATILSAMREIISNKLSGSQSIKVEADEVEDAEIEEDSTTDSKQESKSLESIKKLDSMIAQLDRDHFVSYWS